MRDPTRKRATYEDLKAVPDTKMAQLIDGELIVMSRPAPPHVLSASNVGGDINGLFGRGRPPGGWWILDEPELHLHADIVVPDLAGWRRERMPALPTTAFFTLPPEWVLEVLSPSTASIDRVLKRRIYARESVQHLWFIDPVARFIECEALQGERWLNVGSFAAGEKIRAAPFEAVEFETNDWFVAEG